MVSYVLADEFGSGWPPLGKPVEVEVYPWLSGSTTACCYRRSVLEDSVSCGYGQCISTMRICESGVAGMLGYMAVGKACLVQFGDAGALALK